MPLLLIFQFVSMSLLCAATSTGISTERFEKRTLCDVSERFNQNCMWAVTSRGFLHCSVQCSRLQQCTGFSQDDDGSCFLHSQCTNMAACGEPDTNHSYYFKRPKGNPCQNGGVWTSASDTCSCDGGWVGDRCEHLGRNCSELFLHGYSTGTHTVTLRLENSLEAFQASCTLLSPLRLRLNLLDMSTLDNLDKTWDEYESGFSGWIGLQNMKLALDGYCSLCDVVLTLRFGHDTYIRFIYKGLRLGDAIGGYKLSYTSVKISVAEKMSDEVPVESIGDCFEQLQGVPFSTRDVDRDGDAARNCARDVGNGWWFPSCSNSCNPLGKFYTFGNPEPYSDEYIRIPGVGMRNLALTRELNRVLFFADEI